jgi:hypothetical protein
VSTTPRSQLLQAVLACLRDHPHDTTPESIARRLGSPQPPDIAAALQALLAEQLVITAVGHWQLSHRGFRAAGPAPPE